MPNYMPADARISLYAVEVQDLMREHAATAPTAPLPVVEVVWNRKYAKIVRHDPGVSRVVHSFVDRTNGDILRAASASRPTPDYTYGSVMADTKAERLTGVNGYGIDWII